MLYALLRWAARVALRWYYREIAVVGGERVPADAPLLLAVNHPNALVDALAIGTALPRPVTLTAKATLMEHPIVAALFRGVGIVPLRRAHDERARLAKGKAGARDGTVAAERADEANVAVGGGPPSDVRTSADASAPAPSRNADAFRAILDTLERRGAVLIFPEGISHSAPELAPLKTGLARMALEARDGREIRDLVVVPIGLTFERKWEPRSRVLIEVGEPLPIAEWRGGGDSAPALTAEIDRRLRAVTLNFASTEAADAVLGATGTLAAVLDDDVRPLGAPDPSLAVWADATRRAERVRRRLESAVTAAPGGEAAVDPARVARFLERLERLRAESARLGIALNDVGLRLDLGAGARFAVRESLLLLLGGPLALWGRVNHWIPITLARRLALRSSRNPDDPAMRTIVIGLALVTLFYLLQSALVLALAGPLAALLYVVSLPPSAGWDFALRERIRRAHQRTRTYLLLRRDPALRARLRDEIRWLREEAAAIETVASPAASPPPAIGDGRAPRADARAG